ncbi:MAG: hypothetical protein JJ863_08405 [Deltaproteobacteria bacterium]|nr:hypothetical protein [Deltaproteobacteria bacterium]
MSASFFRGPRGLRRLFTIVYVGAVVVAEVIVWQRPALEGLVHQGVATPSDDTLESMRAAQRSGELGEVDLDELYAAYLRASEPERFDRLPALAFDADGAGMAARVRQTMAAGSPTQRLRAAEFARRSCHDEGRAALEWGMDWNRRVRELDSGLERALEQADCSHREGTR